MIKSILLLMLSLFFVGCATWNGVKQDASDAASWSKQKVNRGAAYVKEKTE